MPGCKLAMTLRVLISNPLAEVTINPDFAIGQRASLHHGIVHAGEVDSYMVTPADLPRLTSADCGALITSHAAAPDSAVTVPMRHGQDGPERGNPIMLSGVALEEAS
jgi:CTP:molybdopterin cytidylyltransferase MocA